MPEWDQRDCQIQYLIALSDSTQVLDRSVHELRPTAHYFTLVKNFSHLEQLRRRNRRVIRLLDAPLSRCVGGHFNFPGDNHCGAVPVTAGRTSLRPSSSDILTTLLPAQADSGHLSPCPAPLRSQLGKPSRPENRIRHWSYACA